MKTGRYGHHPDPAIDFEVECDELHAMKYDLTIGRASASEFRERLDKALDFRVGGDLSCVEAKRKLRMLDSVAESKE